MIRSLLARIAPPGRVVAPPIPPLPEGCLCRCGALATEQWWPGVCSLECTPRDWVPVCAACDVALNEIVVRLLYGHAHEAELSAYRKERLSGPQV